MSKIDGLGLFLLLNLEEKAALGSLTLALPRRKMTTSVELRAALDVNKPAAAEMGRAQRSLNLE